MRIDFRKMLFSFLSELSMVPNCSDGDCRNFWSLYMCGVFVSIVPHWLKKLSRCWVICQHCLSKGGVPSDVDHILSVGTRIGIFCCVTYSCLSLLSCVFFLSFILLSVSVKWLLVEMMVRQEPALRSLKHVGPLIGYGLRKHGYQNGRCCCVKRAIKNIQTFMLL